MRFDPERATVLELGRRRFFLLRLDARELLLVRATCPHRGGPLHLGRLDVEAGVIHCPWHSRRVSLRYLRNEAVPLIVRRDGATAIFPDDESTPVCIMSRTILAKPQCPPAASAPAGQPEESLQLVHEQ